MNNPNDILIFPSGSVFFFVVIILISIGLLGYCLYLIRLKIIARHENEIRKWIDSNQDLQDSNFGKKNPKKYYIKEKLGGGVVILLLVCWSYSELNLLLQKEPELIISDNGITINKLGFIQYSDIKSINYGKIFEGRRSTYGYIIRLKKDFADYYNRSSEISRFVDSDKIVIRDRLKIDGKHLLSLIRQKISVASNI